ncbi:hypothetical protein EON65_06940 [archaeon]|nr:MAG: hypothetical protein EON65_06940 [archaeon]
MLASENGNANVVRLLIQEGVDINRVDRVRPIQVLPLLMLR